ncbi:hypothetical protein L6250_00215 [Candidatus Parcubacteria bacterium]|nr:hypothetical protein [Patescibacteria group bacterium]MBU4466879.1 hypothetical protein [Patescibacteria group bacterium]MCG2688058.1 hypothetical protein [Candidatus Parcubacteria bacterium]
MARTKGNISQEILCKLLLLESVVIAHDSVRFWPQLFKLLFKDQQVDKRKIKDAFYYLKNQGLITGEIINGQLHIRLTAIGKKEAAKYRLVNLKINSSKAWDKKWRLIIFDPAKKEKAFLTKLRDLGFHSLQKNVWIIPFACTKEIKALREFFGFEVEDLRLIETNNLEEAKGFKDFFSLK